MVDYKTIGKEAKTVIIIEKSKFIGYASPVSTREEAETFFKRIRGQEKNATHNVPAFVIGENSELQWASDDGEPQGTAGAPIVQMLVKEGLTNLAIVVTRYFGGIKLGTGGLVRAYTKAAKQAVDEADISLAREQFLFVYKIDYGSYSKLENLIKEKKIDLTDTIFQEDVIVTLAAYAEERAELCKFMENITYGKGVLMSEDIRVVIRKMRG